MALKIVGIILAVIAIAVVVFRKEISETMSMLGTGFGNLGRGWQTGFSAFFSPQVTPVFHPKIGLDICVPILGIPCTVTTREQGTVAGSGTASAGFQSNIPQISQPQQSQSQYQPPRRVIDLIDENRVQPQFKGLQWFR